MKKENEYKDVTNVLYLTPINQILACLDQKCHSTYTTFRFKYELFWITKLKEPESFCFSDISTRHIKFWWNARLNHSTPSWSCSFSAWDIQESNHWWDFAGTHRILCDFLPWLCSQSTRRWRTELGLRVWESSDDTATRNKSNSREATNRTNANILDNKCYAENESISAWNQLEMKFLWKK